MSNDFKYTNYLIVLFFCTMLGNLDKNFKNENPNVLFWVTISSNPSKLSEIKASKSVHMNYSIHMSDLRGQEHGHT